MIYLAFSVTFVYANQSFLIYSLPFSSLHYTRNGAVGNFTIYYLNYRILSVRSLWFICKFVHLIT